MVFDYQPDDNAGLLAAFAQFTGGRLENGLLTLPETVGNGYIRGYSLSPVLRLMVHQYVLRDDLLFRRATAQGETDTLTLTFHDVFQPTARGGQATPIRTRLPAVQITSTDMDFETFFLANTPINTIIVSVQVELLRERIGAQPDHPLLQTILSGTQSYWYESFSSPDIQAVAAAIVAANAPDSLENFYIKLKAEELLYMFLAELVKRQQTGHNPLKPADVKVIYAVRDRVIADLSVPPNLPQLARFAGMSESKLKQLFRQVFGDSLYHYYQTLRMNEAAYLLREEHLSVSETGYRLGFTNLSHFSRLFARHMGSKPKKYAMPATDR